MTLRRIEDQVFDDERGGVYEVNPCGGHVLLTVEEYREQLEEALRDGYDEGVSDRDAEDDCIAGKAWERSATKVWLDGEVGP